MWGLWRWHGAVALATAPIFQRLHTERAVPGYTAGYPQFQPSPSQTSWQEATARRGLGVRQSHGKVGPVSGSLVCLLMGLTLNLKSSWLVEPFMANDWERLRKKGRGSGPREPVPWHPGPQRAPSLGSAPAPGLTLPAWGLTCSRRTLRPPRPCWRSHSLQGRAGGRV